MDIPTIPLDLEEALSILWEKVWLLDTHGQEQARLNYRLNTEMTAALGVIGLLLTLRAQVVELEEKVKGWKRTSLLLNSNKVKYGRGEISSSLLE